MNRWRALRKVCTGLFGSLATCRQRTRVLVLAKEWIRRGVHVVVVAVVVVAAVFAAVVVADVGDGGVLLLLRCVRVTLIVMECLKPPRGKRNNDVRVCVAALLVAAVAAAAAAVAAAAVTALLVLGPFLVAYALPLLPLSP